MSSAINHFFSPTGRYTAAVCGSRIAVWEGLTEEPVFVVSGRPGTTFDRIVWTPSGDVLAATTKGGEVQAWSIPGGKATVRWFPMAGSEPIKAISCSPLGTYIAALTESQSVLIWNVSDGKMAAHLGVSFSAKDLSWSADELVLFTDLSPICWWDGGTLRLFLLPDQLTYLEAFTSPQSASDGEDLLAMLAALAQSSHAPEMVRIFAGQLLPPSAA